MACPPQTTLMTAVRCNGPCTHRHQHEHTHADACHDPNAAYPGRHARSLFLISQLIPLRRIPIPVAEKPSQHAANSLIPLRTRRHIANLSGSEMVPVARA